MARRGISRAGRRASPISKGRAWVSRRPRSGSGSQRGGRFAISSRRPSRRTSQRLYGLYRTEREETAARDRTRPQPQGIADAAAIPAAPNADPECPRSTSRGASSSSSRTRRPPISCCSIFGADDVADYFVIASGGSERQLDAIADGVVRACATRRSTPTGARARRRRTGSCRFRLGDRPRVHATGARLLPAREAWSEAKTICACSDGGSCESASA